MIGVKVTDCSEEIVTSPDDSSPIVLWASREMGGSCEELPYRKLILHNLLNIMHAPWVNELELEEKLDAREKWHEDFL